MEIFVFDLFKGAGPFIGALKASILASGFPLPTYAKRSQRSKPQKMFLLVVVLIGGGRGVRRSRWYCNTSVLLYGDAGALVHIVLLIALNETSVMTQSKG